MLKTKAIVLFLLLAGAVIAAIIISRNFGAVKSTLPQDRTREINLQQRLQEIEREIANRRAEILKNYYRREADFRNEAPERMARLNEEKKVAWDKYQSERKAVNDRTNYPGYYQYQEDRKKLKATRSDYDDEIRRINKKARSAEDLGFTLNQLNEQRQNDLDQLERLRQDWIAGAVAESNATPQSAASGANIVKGIVISEKSGALIGSEFVRQGGKLGDVTIVSISSDAVEFEKNGKRWKQGINETPNPAWQE